MKRYISTMIITFILVVTAGCQGDSMETDQKDTTISSTSNKSVASVGKSETPKKENKSDNDWIKESNAAEVLSIAGIKGPINYFVNDLDNDNVPEVIAYYGPFSEQLTSNNHGFTIFKNDGSSPVWKVSGEFKDNLVNEFQLHGLIENSKREKFIVGSQTIASATNMYSAMKVFKYNPDNQEIQSVSTIAISEENPYEVQIHNNTISLHVLDGDGNVQTMEVWEFKTDWILSTQNKTVLLMATENYFDRTFKEELNNGRLKGIPYTLGTNIIEIKNEIGTPDVEEFYQGAPTFGYSESNLFFSHLMNEVQLVSIIFKTEKTALNFKELESLLGTPEYAGIDEMSGIYTHIYSINNNYILIAEGYTHNEDSGIARIQFKSSIK